MDVSTVVTFIKDVFTSFLVLIMMILPGSGEVAESYQAEDSDALITSFVVVSDIHVETNHPTAYRNLSAVLKGIKAGEDISAVVYTGDNVMNGQVTEDFLFYAAISGVKPAENNLVVAGNHDYGNGEGEYESMREKFLRNNALYLGNNYENDYYYRVIDGCYMIVLVSEEVTATDFRMSDEQLAWLESVLKEAQVADAPVYVFNHFPLWYLKDHSPADLAGMLKEYDVQLFVHGHIHNDMGADNFYEYYGVDCINLPRVTETTEYAAGDGIVVEVYEDKTVVRARDFMNGEWIEDLRYEYEAD